VAIHAMLALGMFLLTWTAGLAAGGLGMVFLLQV
jgi:hypothetical protein